MHRVPGWAKVLRFVNVIDPRTGTLSPRKVAAWVALGAVVYSVLSGREAPLLAILSTLIGG